MARTSTTVTESSAHTSGSSSSQTSSKSESKNVLDKALMEEILSGLIGQMTQEEAEESARNLLTPGLNAALEANRQSYETSRQSREQEIADLAAALTGSIEQQKAAYRQSNADVQNAALARGMGRSSYALDTLAGQGRLLAEAVERLTAENERKTKQIREQMATKADQMAQTEARLKTDFETSVAAKIQEVMDAQRKESNANYLTAISAAMGKQTTGSSQTNTQSSSDTHSESVSTTTSSSGGGSSKRIEPKEEKQATMQAGGGRTIAMRQTK